MREIDAGHSAHRAVVLACAVGGLAALMLVGCGSARLTSAASARPVPGSPVPASAIPRLRAIADWYVRGDSQTGPHWVSVVKTSRKKALASATLTEEATLGVRNITVYLVTMKGRFLSLPVPSPLRPGEKPPTGEYLSIVVDAKTFRVLDLALRPKPPPVAPASLGPVTYLTPWQVQVIPRPPRSAAPPQVTYPGVGINVSARPPAAPGKLAADAVSAGAVLAAFKTQGNASLVGPLLHSERPAIVLRTITELHPAAGGVRPHVPYAGWVVIYRHVRLVSYGLKSFPRNARGTFVAIMDGATGRWTDFFDYGGLSSPEGH